MVYTSAFWSEILGGFFYEQAKVLLDISIDTLYGNDDRPTSSIGDITLFKPNFEGFKQGVRGISIPFNLRLTNILGRNIEVGIFFINENGKIIKTNVSCFSLQDGICAIGRQFISNAYNMNISDNLFIPYGILDIKNTQEMLGKVYVHVDDKREIILTNSFQFNYFVYTEDIREYTSEPRVDELDAIIGLVAIVIRTDGITAKEEIQTVLNFFQPKLNINLDLVRERLKKYLNTPPDLRTCCNKLKHIETQKKYMIVSLLLNFSVSDGEADREELELINRIYIMLEILESNFIKMKQCFLSEKQKSLELLGLKMGASNQLIMSAYKRKCKEFEPEQYNNLPKGMRDLARKQCQELKTAFDVLCEK